MSKHERFVKIRRFVKVCMVCQGMKGLPRYEGVVKVCSVCKDIKGLSRYFKRICQEKKVFDFC